MKYFPRLRDLAQKAWKYGLGALEQPQHIPRLALLVLRGVHLGEFRKLNQSWIKQAGINTLLDIGAHTGESSSAVRAILPGVRTYAFEPLPDCCERLRKRMARYGSFQAFQVALGDQRGQVTFWRSSFSKSSSVLSMADLHKVEFPWSAGSAPITVQMALLDDYHERMELVPKVLLKLDVQGYEDQVIRGGAEVLKRVDYVLTEVSFRPLYEGQPLFHEIYSLLVDAGFYYAGNLDQLHSPSDGSILQADALFVRNPQPHTT